MNRMIRMTRFARDEDLWRDDLHGRDDAFGGMIGMSPCGTDDLDDLDGCIEKRRRICISSI